MDLFKSCLITTSAYYIQQLYSRITQLQLVAYNKIKTQPLRFLNFLKTKFVIIDNACDPVHVFLKMCSFRSISYRFWDKCKFRIFEISNFSINKFKLQKSVLTVFCLLITFIVENLKKIVLSPLFFNLIMGLGNKLATHLHHSSNTKLTYIKTMYGIVVYIYQICFYKIC